MLANRLRRPRQRDFLCLPEGEKWHDLSGNGRMTQGDSGAQGEAGTKQTEELGLPAFYQRLSGLMTPNHAPQVHSSVRDRK